MCLFDKRIWWKYVNKYLLDCAGEMNNTFYNNSFKYSLYCMNQGQHDIKTPFKYKLVKDTSLRHKRIFIHIYTGL